MYTSTPEMAPGRKHSIALATFRTGQSTSQVVSKTRKNTQLKPFQLDTVPQCVLQKWMHIPEKAFKSSHHSWFEVFGTAHASSEKPVRTGHKTMDIFSWTQYSIWGLQNSRLYCRRCLKNWALSQLVVYRTELGTVIKLWPSELDTVVQMWDQRMNWTQYSRCSIQTWMQYIRRYLHNWTQCWDLCGRRTLFSWSGSIHVTDL